MPRRAAVLIAPIPPSRSRAARPRRRRSPTARRPPWSYTAGDGKTYTLPEVPERIIAHADAAKALMSFGITPVGVYADGRSRTTPA